MRLLAAAGFVLLCAIACRGEDAQPGVPPGEKEILLSDSEAARLLEQAKLYLNEATGPYAYMAEYLLSEIVRRFPASPEAVVAKLLLEERGVASEPDKEADTSGPRVFGIPLDSLVNPLTLSDDETPPPGDVLQPGEGEEEPGPTLSQLPKAALPLHPRLYLGRPSFELPPEEDRQRLVQPTPWRNPPGPTSPSGPRPPFFETPPMEHEYKRRPFQEGDPYWNLVPEGSL